MKRRVFKVFMIGLLVLSVFALGACGSTQKTNGTASGGNSDNSQKSTDTNSGNSNSPYDLSKVSSHTIRAGIGLNSDTPEGKGLAMFKQLVEKNSGGKIKVKNFYSAQLGDDLQMTSALQAGTQEVTIPSTSPLVGIVKEFGLFDLPYTFNNRKEAYAVLDGPVGQAILKKLQDHGLVGLGYWENGFRNVTNSKHPIKTVADFKGLKLRVMQNDIFISAFKALGVNPTPMAFSQVFNALQSHTVDGQENPYTTILSNKFYEVNKYVSSTQHVYTPFVFLIGKKFWDKLDPTEQKIIKDAAVKAGKWQREDNAKENSTALAKLKEKGMVVTQFPDAQKDKIREILKPVLKKYTQQYGVDLYNQMEAQLKKIRGQ